LGLGQPINLRSGQAWRKSAGLWRSIAWRSMRRSSTAARPLALDHLALDAAQLDGRQASACLVPQNANKLASLNFSPD